MFDDCAELDCIFSRLLRAIANNIVSNQPKVRKVQRIGLLGWAKRDFSHSEHGGAVHQNNSELG